MGELGQELGLFVVLEVNVVLREVDLQPCESSGRADLRAEDTRLNFGFRKNFGCISLTVLPLPCPGVVQRVPIEAIL